MYEYTVETASSKSGAKGLMNNMSKKGWKTVSCSAKTVLLLFTHHVITFEREIK